MTIKLYELVGRDEARPFSPHVWKVRMALARKGLPYDVVPTRYLDVPAVENGASKTLPVIRDGERIVADSFAIALYLEDAYPDRPTLFGGEGGKAVARFVEGWTNTDLHAYIRIAALMDIFVMQDDANKAYFRRSREQRFGKPLEEVGAERNEGLPAFRTSLEPLRATLAAQPWIGGRSPLFADYIVFGALQWARVTMPLKLLAEDDPVAEWFARCLALHDGLGAGVPAAA